MTREPVTYPIHSTITEPNCQVLWSSECPDEDCSRLVSRYEQSPNNAGPFNAYPRDTLPVELQAVLLDQQLRLTREAASPSSPYYAGNKVVLRKLFSTVSAK